MFYASTLKCSNKVKKFINNFIKLLHLSLDDELLGVYLHGSLAMDCYNPNTSDIDIVAVTKNKLNASLANTLLVDIANYAASRSIISNLEFSIITLETANTIPNPIPYELHYSSSWHERILNSEVKYNSNQFDPDLFAHLFVIKKRGITLFGKDIDEVFNNVLFEYFLDAVLDDLNWILEGENILKNPLYNILNICRVFQLLITNTQEAYNKKEGGIWALSYFPENFSPLIKFALDVYQSKTILDKTNKLTGEIIWDNKQLLSFRDYVLSLLKIQ